MKRKAFIVLILLLTPLLSSAQETLNIGLVKGLWFSEDKYFAGDEIRVNGAFFNDSSSTIKGEVVFYVDQEEFYREEVNIKTNTLKQIEAPYLAKEGKHVFEAKVVSAIRINEDGSEEGVFVKTNLILGEETLTVDLDTDGDNIGNKQDTDDDGDGYSDIVESQNGTDPLSEEDFPKIGKDLEENDSSRQDNVDRVIKDLEDTASEISDKTSGFVSSALERLGESNLKELEESANLVTESDENQENATSSDNIVIKIVKNLDDKRESVKSSIGNSLLEKTKENISLPSNEQERLSENGKVEKGFTYHFLNIMFFIFKSVFWSILFILFLIWLLWKIISWIFIFIKRRKEKRVYEEDFDD